VVSVMLYNCSKYLLDNYVHRLVHNKTDGKLVEVGTSDNVSLCVVLHIIGNIHTDSRHRKIGLLTIRGTTVFCSMHIVCWFPQYTYLLTSQLESQRHYFEGKVAQIETAAQEQVRT